jgi:hypothetical protein
MANLRPRRLSPSDLDTALTRPPRARRWPLVVAAVVAGLAVLAWFDGGEEPLRPIAQDVALPGQGQ